MCFTLQPSRFGNDKVKVLFMCSYMRDAAFSWVQPYLDNMDTDDEEPFLTMFPLFLNALRGAFDDPDQAKTAQWEITQLNQGGSSASEFAANFQRLAAYTGWNDQAHKYHFTIGPNDRLQDELATRDLPDDFNEYIQKVIQLDNRMRERKLTKGKKSSNQPPHQSRQPRFQVCHHRPLKTTMASNQWMSTRQPPRKGTG